MYNIFVNRQKCHLVYKFPSFFENYFQTFCANIQGWIQINLQATFVLIPSCLIKKQLEKNWLIFTEKSHFNYILNQLIVTLTVVSAMLKALPW